MLGIDQRNLIEFLSTLPPFAVIVLTYIPIPNFIAWPFRPVLTVKEAEQLDAQFAAEDAKLAANNAPAAAASVTLVVPKAPRWRTRFLRLLSALEFVAWLAIAIYNIVQTTHHHETGRPFSLLPWTPFLLAVTWAYTLLRVLHRPVYTPPYDVFLILVAHFACASFALTYQLLNRAPTDSWDLNLIAQAINFDVILICLGIVMSLPLNLQSNAKGDDNLTISPEDYTTLFGWITFSWVNPLLVSSSKPRLEDGDVWDLSNTLKTRPTFYSYIHTPASGLFVRLVRANSMDLFIDFLFNEVSVVLDFGGPFFLQKILAGLENGGQTDPMKRREVYLYAVLMFLANVLKAESDLQHLWYGRRASSRMNTQLSAAIYDKALRITDQSGVVSKKKGEEAASAAAANADGSDAPSKGKGKDKNKDASKKDDKKDNKEKGKEESESESESDASVGKIVNLMSIDCRRVWEQVSGMPHIYTAPLQLVLSCIYLYQLLGISAFVGFGIMLLVLPITKLLADAVMRINKGNLAARDERMKMVDEMFNSIKFIKFFAWEKQWIEKIVKARMVEMEWLRKGRNVNVLYSLLWSLVPTSISLISFLTYILLGNKLTVSTAFTAVRLFDMIRLPLGVLPYAMISFTQTKVSLERIRTFLNEGEVPDDVCTLTREVKTTPEEISIERASFKWTTGGAAKEKETSKDKDKSKGKGNMDPPVMSGPAHATVSGAPMTPAEHVPEETLIGVVASASESTIVGDLDRSTIASTLLGPSAATAGGERQVFELRDISLRLPKGKLTVVTGATASGKTALLMALLGEMEKTSGTQVIPKNPSVVDEHGLQNSIAYAAQTPWLQQQSIRDNITFEYPFDQERYDAVIEACALKPDFAALEDGDLTEIGAKGVSLSGGQKARVALARAIYAPTEYLILDDIFSAVDSHTARFLYEKLLRGSLVAHRTILLVTHHVELVLPGTHYLVQMADGRIARQGTPAELKARGELDYVAHEVKEEEEEEAIEEIMDEVDGGKKKKIPGQDGDAPRKPARKLVEEEVRSEGGVKWYIYKTYLKASGLPTWVLVGIGGLLAETLEIGTKVWMSIWGEAYNRAPVASLALAALVKSPVKALTDAWPSQHLFSTIVASNATVVTTAMTATALPHVELPDANTHPMFYVVVFSIIGVSASLISSLTEYLLFTAGMRSGLVLFKELLGSLSRSTFRFFDITPVGRILNRFGKDFDQLDGYLSFMIHHCIMSITAFVGAVVTVIAVVPMFAPVAAILAYVYYQLSVLYLKTGRDLRRMESNARSPIIAGFSDLVSGIVTVRAFSTERQFLKGHFKRVDTGVRFWYFSWMLNRWLLYRFDNLGALSVFAATLFVLSGYISVGMAALSIVSAMTFSQGVYWTCRGFTELELALNAVERVVEYLEVPQEPPAVDEKNRVPAYWPSSSDNASMLVVEDLEVKYAPELPSVLHGVSFALKARERVGLLGRTGCGKSTLAMSLLRFIEPHKGRIIIDGIDITKIGTYDLRSRITFIPQDATLFAGTVRENLDPFSEHTDAECLEALTRVHLITPGSQKSSRAPSIMQSDREEETVPSSSSIVGSETATSEAEGKVIITLDSVVSAGGQNFSNGQRQLLALARALLRQSAVVIFDEATSSIDKAADIKIQAAIREEFNRSLLLTIAHRLGTIIDFDRLIVLDKGHIAEFDTPYNLIHKEGGIFREMCIQSGTFTELEAAAKAQAKAQGHISA